MHEHIVQKWKSFNLNHGRDPNPLTICLSTCSFTITPCRHKCSKILNYRPIIYDQIVGLELQKNITFRNELSFTLGAINQKKRQRKKKREIKINEKIFKNKIKARKQNRIFKFRKFSFFFTQYSSPLGSQARANLY